MTIREERGKRTYLGRRTILRYFTCTFVTLLVISITATLAGFYWLIGLHVDQAVRLSAIKGLEIRATTLAEQKM